ncbi:MAG: ABC transporter ATP-binding protein [Candidatus Sumerlaeia bacterium]|nr:ABC transporter ATP-binding protein [Candidatus Sumerlaeia bacterium]
MTAKKILLEAQDVVREFLDGSRVLRVLRGVNLAVPAGESVAITGHSGAGKSTLLHLLAGLDRPTSGRIIFDSVNLTSLNDLALARFCNRTIAIIFQFYHLLSEFSALENTMMPGLIAGRPRTELRRRAVELLEAVGLADRLHHRPSQLSGGEQQRVAIARALINNPSLILADEPTGNLDEETGEAIIQLLWNETVGRGRTLIIVTHEPSIAARADRRFLLTEGKLHEQS